MWCFLLILASLQLLHSKYDLNIDLIHLMYMLPLDFALYILMYFLILHLHKNYILNRYHLDLMHWHLLLLRMLFYNLLLHLVHLVVYCLFSTVHIVFDCLLLLLLCYLVFVFLLLLEEIFTILKHNNYYILSFNLNTIF